MTAWHGLVPFVPWLADGRSPALLGTPPELPAPAPGAQSGQLADGHFFVCCWTAAGKGGWCAGLSGLAADQIPGAAALLSQTIAACGAVPEPDFPALGHWSHHALHGLAQAIGTGSTDLQTILGTALQDARTALPARVMGVAQLDLELGMMEVTACAGAPLSTVRKFVEAYAPTWGRHSATQTPMPLPDGEAGWGHGCALPLITSGGTVGLLVAWSDQAADPAWVTRAGWIASHVALIIGAARRENDWQEALLGVFAAVAAAIDAKAPFAAGQSGRSTLLALAIADELGPVPISRRDLRLAGLLHDIGNIAIPDGIMAKKGTLTASEIAHIRQHPNTAARMLAGIPQLAEVRRTILYHHERWDGAGYPERLSGTGIPVGARILALADALIALLSQRPYREALSCDVALTEISGQFGAQFDPDVGAALLRCLA
ncbi:MAG: HD domain-containing protein, partial [Candidatus Sericytochromatia bacterium]|nr:HD domain-containing protein [Candidatus Sericytochromatia bacterium]